MPTYERLPVFNADGKALSHTDRQRFSTALAVFVADLRAKGGFRRGLRVKRVQGRRGVYEITWAPDGHATFSYGPEQREGEPHLIWRRIGDHSIVTRP